MLDVHDRLYGTTINIFGIPAYSFFVSLGICFGLLFYLMNLKQQHKTSEGAVKIVFSALICGLIGSKIPLILEGRHWVEVLYGKSIVGGLVGGLFGVIAIKKILGIKLKLGNVIAPSVALGMAIGRLGCFFNGCCVGVTASWGFDFGDGFLRLPTQLFEMGFHGIAFILLVYYQNKVKTPGILFKFYLLAYFTFRFLLEFIRMNPLIFLGMTVYQNICLLGVVYIIIVLYWGKKRAKNQLPIVGSDKDEDIEKSL